MSKDLFDWNALQREFVCTRLTAQLKRALHTLKRALYTLKRVLHTLKRALHNTQKSPIYTQGDRVGYISISFLFDWNELQRENS